MLAARAERARLGRGSLLGARSQSWGPELIGTLCQTRIAEGACSTDNTNPVALRVGGETEAREAASTSGQETPGRATSRLRTGVPPPTPGPAWPAPRTASPVPVPLRRLWNADPSLGGAGGRARAPTHLAERGAGPPLPSAQPTKFRWRPAGIARGPAVDARALDGRRGAAADADDRGAGSGAAWAPSERPRAPRPPAGPAALHAPSRLPLASAAARRGRGAPSGEKLFPLQTKKGDT